MDFELTEAQRRIQQTAHDFAARSIAPWAAELDRTSRWPKEIVARMGELGLIGLAIPVEHGGAGHDQVSRALAIEEVSRACAGCGVILNVTGALFCDPLLRHGTGWQQQEILRPAASGSTLGALALTDSTRALSADTAPATPATPTLGERLGDGGYLLNGAKGFVAVGPEAEHVIVLARTAADPERPRYTALLVRRGTPGFTRSPRDETTGARAAHRCALHFENVRVPKEHVLGEDGGGEAIAREALEGGRIGVAARAVGIARAALEAAVAWAKAPRAGGGPLSELQSIQHMIADMATEIDAARLLTLRAATLKDKGARYGAESATAKLFASETATRVAHKALQIHGDHGYTTGSAAERHDRDARITEIDAGGSGHQRVIIATGMLTS